MTTKRESLIIALFQKIETLASDEIKVYRNLDKPLKIPAGGIIILRDNEVAKEVDVLLNPLTYIYELSVQLEVMAQHHHSNMRAQLVDILLLQIERVIIQDRTLNGLVEYLEAKPPEFQEEPVDGAGTIRSAIVPVMVRFNSSDSF